ncbi:patatin-like phospholipase family protein [Mitsuaria sp. TWR114]|uniref:patatin-like phospholipase family protein n=1 Tax=Mitsuaria sp. TWR114 TaxID=2601731 RepID=UPI00210306F6|nr:patatin-like phospholipase family protein [Mitsuaria sp. TWR114]
MPDGSERQTLAQPWPRRDDEVLIAEAMALLPPLRPRLQALIRRIEVPPPWDDEAQRQRWKQDHPRVPVSSDWATYERWREALIDARLKWLRAWIHRLGEDEAPAALCLSGGGIRSATFSLGVIQGLAAKGVMRDFHYLSSVSGGGYITSLLSAWIRNEALLRQADAAGMSLADYMNAGMGSRAPIQTEGPALSDARAAVLDTHSHGDHASSAQALRDAVPELLSEDARPGRVDALGWPAGAEVIALGGYRLSRLATPGHTEDSTAYLLHAGGDLVATFVGDTVMPGALGRSDFAQSARPPSGRR